MTTDIPWGPLGYITFKRTYTRPTIEGKTEEYADLVKQRIVPALNSQLGCGFTDAELTEFTQLQLQLKGSVAGRFLWQLGTETVNKLGLMSLQNCGGIVINKPVEPFCWVMDSLMLGVGVGFNIQREFVYELPKPLKGVTIERKDVADADFIVPDSREGWVELLRRTLLAHFFTGKSFTYSTMLIRGKGAPIKGFGGVAAGPEELCWGLNEIGKTLTKRAGKKLRPIDCLDLLNIIGYIVVAGNVRRSAQIAIGDSDDIQFLQAKRWDLGNIPNWRAMSNNSVVCNDFAKLLPEFWEGYKGKGESYGLINLKLSQKTGRLGEEVNDHGIVVYNPCAEQGLNDYETCCLAEIFLSNITSQQELKTLATYLYKVCKHSLVLDCHQEETEKIVHENMRMGIGVTGVCQSTQEQLSWLDHTYEHLRQLDIQYSAEKGWPVSIKLTTVKPSGTLSLGPGCTPGGHPGIFQYFIRRIRIASGSPLVVTCKEHGYHVEYQKKFDGTLDYNTSIVEFPCSYPEGTKLAKDMSAVAQLENVKYLQTVWSDNSVSCTIYYNKDELEEVKGWLAANYNTSVKTCSFMLHRDHGFVQAPYEEITKEQYETLLTKVRPITSVEVSEIDMELEECESGHCPTK